MVAGAARIASAVIHACRDLNQLPSSAAKRPPLQSAYVNRIATATPAHEVHRHFLRFAHAQLSGNDRLRSVFGRMAERSGIDRRYSFLEPYDGPNGLDVDAEGIFRRGAFPTTGARMALFERHAPGLARLAVERLALGPELARTTHLVVTSCTGFSAPGIDLELVERCGLPRSIERTIVGFMGCYAAINGLKLARHIVRSEPEARVLVVNLELCTLHLKETADLEQLLTFCLWGDGCAASLVTAEPKGAALDGFRAFVAPETADLMAWSVGDDGFDMVLSGQVPAAVREAIAVHRDEILEGASAGEIDLWAVHPGGRTILDAVEAALDLTPAALTDSREVLRSYGNMSSATVMFVLDRLLARGRPGARGCGMAFGPGLTAETMTFHIVP